MKTTTVTVREFRVCSCGAVGPLAEDGHGVYYDPTGVLIFRAPPDDYWEKGLDVPPPPSWSCGAAGHFALMTLEREGTLRSTRDLETLKAFITPEMLELVQRAQDGGLRERVAEILAEHPELVAAPPRRW